MDRKIIIAIVICFILCGMLFTKSVPDQGSKKLPIVYSDDYNIGFYKIQKLHPFDTGKYEKAYDCLLKAGLGAGRFVKPEPAGEKDLLLVHTKEYLNSLKESRNIAAIAELGILKVMPNFILQKKLLYPMKLATGGTMRAAELALEYGWAINMSGGYHHAKAESGGGFCFFADIPIAVHRLWQRNASLRVLVIDLDAHQGNGIESVFKNDKRTAVLDVYNKDIYPLDDEAKSYIKFNFPLRSNTGDEEYLSIIKTAVPDAIDRFHPGFIFYNAGTDILAGDPLGNLNVSEQGIIKRDEIVMRSALERKIPAVMVLSGGYTKQSGQIIGKSIVNILKNVVKAL